MANPGERGRFGTIVVVVVAFAIGAAAMYMYKGGPGPEPTPAPPQGVAAAPPAPSGPPSAEPTPLVVAEAVPEPAAPPAAGGAPARPRRGAASGPQRAAAAPAPPAAPALPPPPAGTFRATTTSVESLKGIGAALRGFEADGVGVKRAPEVNGRLDLEVEPSGARPGQPFTVKVYLMNEGQKAIRLKELTYSMLVDGKWSHHAAPMPKGTINPKQRALVHEVPGEWKDGVKSWAMEVVATSNREDVYKTKLVWQ
ncbi:MAG TPA: hypothetical protein VFM29_06040 [Vicinamibacteria bacterium]|nr:hypothetical protein [Vicinamibacteria bacterium]